MSEQLYPFLDEVNSPEDIKKLYLSELNTPSEKLHSVEALAKDQVSLIDGQS